MNVKIPKNISLELGKIKGAQAILLTGSRAIGKESKNSDWDFFVILKDGESRWRQTYKVGNTWLELLCNDYNQIKKEFKEDLEEGRGSTTMMFATGQIVSDPKGILRKLTAKAKENWRKRPSALSRIRLEWVNYQISTYIQDIEDCLHDGNPAFLLMNYAVNEFVNYYYRLGRIWMPRPKDRMDDLRRRSRVVYELVKRFNSTGDWVKKSKLAVRLGKHVGKQYGLSLNGEAYIPAKKLAIS